MKDYSADVLEADILKHLNTTLPEHVKRELTSNQIREIVRSMSRWASLEIQIQRLDAVASHGIKNAMIKGHKEKLVKTPDDNVEEPFNFMEELKRI